MKPNATPRMMRDGIWTMGSVSMPRRNNGHPSTWIIAGIGAAVIILIATGVI